LLRRDAVCQCCRCDAVCCLLSAVCCLLSAVTASQHHSITASQHYSITEGTTLWPPGYASVLDDAPRQRNCFAMAEGATSVVCCAGYVAMTRIITCCCRHDALRVCRKPGQPTLFDDASNRNCVGVGPGNAVLLLSSLWTVFSLVPGPALAVILVPAYIVPELSSDPGPWWRMNALTW
jgi:hypothetical protein